MPHSGMGAEGTILEKDDVRRLVGYAKELGLEVIPEVQSLGHVQYLTYAYPEIAEIDPNAQQEKDLRAEDAKPNQFFHHCYCPSLDKSYEIIYDVIDEIVEVVQPPRFVHIGHDEVYQIGICPRCKDTAPDVLFERHVRALYDHIKAKGLRTMLWADMLIREKRYATVPARDRLPKDIVALDFIWYFAFGEDTEQVLLDRSYEVAVGNLYSSHFPRYLSRMNRDGMIGGQISMWVRTEEKALATVGKFYDMAYLSQMLWNAKNYDERLRPVYTRIVGGKILPALREQLHGTCHKKEQVGAALPLPEGGKGVPQPILQKYPQAIIADGETIAIGNQANRLIFTHAAVRTMPRTSWLEILKVGTYQVHYADGTMETIDLGYGTNVLAYNVTYGKPLPQQYYRHYGYIGTWFADPVFAGKTTDGNDLTFFSMPWDNPHPEKEITSVTYVPHEESLTELILTEIRAM